MQREREFCGIHLPDGLAKDQPLSQLLITPSTKDVMRGLAGVPEADDVNITRADIERHWQAFGFDSPDHINHYEQLLSDGFEVISQHLASIGQLFVDTKFEFGYAPNQRGERELIYMDEVGTPDSSRIWDADAYGNGKIVENSKEGFRQALLTMAPDRDLLLDKQRMIERQAYANATVLPSALMHAVSETYIDIAERITAKPLDVPENPRDEIQELIYGQLLLGL